MGNYATQAMPGLVVPSLGVLITYVPQSPTTALAPPAWTHRYQLLLKGEGAHAGQCRAHWCNFTSAREIDLVLAQWAAQLDGCREQDSSSRSTDSPLPGESWKINLLSQ